jgi:heptosyltransferase-2
MQVEKERAPSVSMSNPIYRLPFQSSIPNDLKREYLSLPRSFRFTLQRKAWSRELLLLAARQRRLRRPVMPPDVQSILLLYSWTTIGDAIMDLSQCALLPPHIEVDLCIAPHLADLFQGDRRFRAVYRSPEECRNDYDFILLQNAGTQAIKTKLQHFEATPFNTIFGHLYGECFSRMDFVAQRLAQLSSRPVAAPAMPSLALDDVGPVLPAAYRIAVAMGGRDQRRMGLDWSSILPAIIAAWPADTALPVFVLAGDHTATDDIAAIAPAFLARHCKIAANKLGLRTTAAVIRDCDAFLGADGGLMHVALAFDKPGLGLFTHIRPEWRMHSDARMRSHFQMEPLSTLMPRDVARRLVAALVPTSSASLTSPRKADRDLPVFTSER